MIGVATLARPVLFALFGAGAGFSYAHFVGCRSGACPLWSNRAVAAIYGGFMGLMIANG